MSSTTARFAYNALRTAVLTVAIAGAFYTMAGGVDTPGNVNGAVTQTGSVIRDYDANRSTFNNDVQLDASQVSNR